MNVPETYCASVRSDAGRKQLKALLGADPLVPEDCSDSDFGCGLYRLAVWNNECGDKRASFHSTGEEPESDASILIQQYNFSSKRSSILANQFRAIVVGSTKKSHETALANLEKILGPLRYF